MALRIIREWLDEHRPSWNPLPVVGRHVPPPIADSRLGLPAANKRPYSLPMLRAFRDLLSLNRASRALGRASRLKARGENKAAADGYADVIRRLDAVGTLPTDAAQFSIRDVSHFSIRLVACAEWAELLEQAGDHDRAQRLAREVLNLCTRAPRKHGDNSDLFLKWEQWARAFIGPEQPPA